MSPQSQPSASPSPPASHSGAPGPVFQGEGAGVSLPPSARENGRRSSDAALIEMLRMEGTPGVEEISEALGVTATAVRQRLERLMREGIVGRDVLRPATAGNASPHGQTRSRGRPSYGYRLTDKGRRLGGDNFRDLALVLWKEIRGVEADEVRRGLLSRIGGAMAGMYREQIRGDGVAERLESVAHLLRQRQIACTVEPCNEAGIEGTGTGGLSILTSHVCPYPQLADQDRGICSAERLMLQDLVGAPVRLASCRLDGDHSCRFVAGHRESAEAVVHPSTQKVTDTRRNGVSEH